MPGTSDPQNPVTVRELEAALATPLTPDEATRLAERLTAQVGRDTLGAGAVALAEELTVAWVVRAPEAQRAAEIVAEVDTAFRRPLTRLGQTDLWVLAVTLDEGTALRWRCEVDGKSRGAGQIEVYGTHPDSMPQPDVPRGTLEQQQPWRGNVFPGTVRDWWLYVPAQYDGSQPASVMVFQDGAGYKDHVAPVFDTLIAEGAMPVTIGVFINPGIFADTTVSNRSYEYDTPSDQYSRFLLEEILPEVGQRYRLRVDPDAGAIAGISSGGICAFTVAWQRPDRFRKVLSWVGSFTNIASGPTLREGGHNYPALIRKAPPKPIRVYLQGGAQDLDNAHGNWPLANQTMAKALEFAGYDYQFVFGRGFHSPLHGRALLPDSLRWLWRGWQA